jgi:hypothetical protein
MMEHLRSFLLNNAVLQIEVDRINAAHSHSRERISREVKGDPLLQPYIPQINAGIRERAAEMASYYEIFYMLENDIRSLISQTLSEERGESWWEVCVPEAVKLSANHNKSRERDAGVSLRSTDPIDYITFGELGEIIKANFDIFGPIINSKKGLEKVMSSLNLLRGTIAHCGILSEDEVLRLKLALRDWYRLMQ